MSWREKIKVKRVKGFTLLELIIVIVIIGVLATASLSKYIKVVERARSAEGKHILGMLRDAQMRYYAEHYPNFATSCGNLDITITSSNNFGAPTCANDINALATVIRTGGYTLKITEDGKINCADNGGSVITCGDANLVVGNN
ncbi:MAG: prepilin-type N-terminal cleavage/methylation domain-containing protein [Candidatus Omnitrophica bacterium]|nr:prepilin-type N-terminal cleavage/methylation domain-containing protein [Candidatus Omnitrophota bacterium]